MNYKHLTLLALLIFCGCNSNSDTAPSAEQVAIIKNGANVTGFQSCGWVIEFNTRFGSTVVPESLPVEFQQDNLEVRIIVTNSADPADCGPGEAHKVRIVTIRLPN